MHQKTINLAKSIDQTGKHKVMNKAYFDTIKVKVADQNKIRERANQKQINLRQAIIKCAIYRLLFNLSFF